jgi:hypothetical protein
MSAVTALKTIDRTLVSILTEIDTRAVRSYTFDGLVVDTANVLRTKTIPSGYPMASMADSAQAANDLMESDRQLYDRAHAIVDEGVGSFRHRLS